MARTKGILSACGMVLWLLVPSSNGTAGDIGVGSLSVHPYVSASVGYTDNVYLTKTRETSDTFYLISPGVKLILPIERHTVSLDYTVDSYIYREQDEADRTIHNVTGVLDLNPRKSLNVQIKDMFTRSEDPPDFKGGRTSPFIWNSPSIDASYDVSSRLGLGAGYRYETKQYDRSVDRIDDYDDNAVSGRLYYRIFPKISFVTFYQYENRGYDKRRREDNDSHRVEGGVTWRIGPKSTGTARVGYMRTDYDRLNRTDEDLSYFVNLTQQLRPKTTLSIEGVRQILDTSRADRNLVFSNDYVSTQIAGTLSHRYRKLTGRVRVGYIQDDYLHDDIAAGRKRKDDLFRAEFGVDHALRKWFTLSGSYRYSCLNSNFKTEEYEENTFLIYCSLVL